MAKHPRYQDYVISNGKLVGEFDDMYRDYADPWNQSKEHFATDKIVALHLLKKYGSSRIIDIGCGLGQFTSMIARETQAEVIGVDISEVAVEKASKKFDNSTFVQGEIMDLDLYRRLSPDALVMAEITWYILDELDFFLDFLRSEFPDILLVHILTMYPPGQQRYGTDFFSDGKGVRHYFNFHYLEWGEVNYPDGMSRHFFAGSPSQPDNGPNS